MSKLEMLQQNMNESIVDAEKRVPRPKILDIDPKELLTYLEKIFAQLVQESKKGNSKHVLIIRRTKSGGFFSQYQLADFSCGKVVNEKNLSLPAKFPEWFHQAFYKSTDGNISEETRNIVNKRREDYFEDVLKFITQAWNENGDYDGIVATRYSNTTTHTTGSYYVNSESYTIHELGIQFSWSKSESPEIEALRTKEKKRHQEWVEARDQLEQAVQKKFKNQCVKQ